MKKLLALLLAVMMLATMVACSDGDDLDKEDLKNYVDKEEFVNFETLASGETFWFEMIDSETITITKYKGSNDLHALVIPEKLGNGEDKKTVTEIATGAFKDCASITALTLPATLEKIDAFAFVGCTRMATVEIPANVTSIENGAFYGCSALKTLTFQNTAEAPAKLAKIGANAFTLCTALEAVVIPGSVRTVEQAAFYGCEKLASVTVSEGVQVIRQQAFQNCSALAEVVLPSTITEMGDFLFNVAGEDHLYAENVTYPAGNAVIEAYFAKDAHKLPSAPAVGA